MLAIYVGFDINAVNKFFVAFEVLFFQHLQYFSAIEILCTLLLKYRVVQGLIAISTFAAVLHNYLKSHTFLNKI